MKTIRGYMTTILDTAAVQQWSADALAETFREPAHEEELAELGEWLEDLRAT